MWKVTMCTNCQILSTHNDDTAKNFTTHMKTFMCNFVRSLSVKSYPKWQQTLCICYHWVGSLLGNMLISCNSTLQTAHNIGIKTRGVSHCCLGIYIKKYLKAKEELWKLQYFTMQKYNLLKKSSKRNKWPSRYHNFI